MFNNETFRYGSADSSDALAIEEAGMFEQTPSSIFVGDLRPNSPPDFRRIRVLICGFMRPVFAT